MTRSPDNHLDRFMLSILVSADDDVVVEGGWVVVVPDKEINVEPKLQPNAEPKPRMEENSFVEMGFVQQEPYLGSPTDSMGLPTCPNSSDTQEPESMMTRSTHRVIASLYTVLRVVLDVADVAVVVGQPIISDGRTVICAGVRNCCEVIAPLVLGTPITYIQPGC